MVAGPHSRTAAAARDSGGASRPRTVYTDGACSGNPGPGGWAWVEPDGPWETGYEGATTNQRMEVQAALAACEAIAGPLEIVSDSTYVVNCWRDRWWEGWLRRDWRNSQRKPVANRDLWERLVPHFRDRDDLRLRWVKGHSGDRWNDVADRLAVRAIERRAGSSGDATPAGEDLGDEDRPRRAATVAVSSDGRIPPGHLITVTGLRRAELASMPLKGRGPGAELVAVLAAQHQLHPDAVVLSGLRTGAEQLGALAAGAAGVPWAAVLPYPEPTAGWPEVDVAAFERLLAGAAQVVTLERRRPTDAAGRRAALERRDGWLRSSSAGAVVLTDGADAEAELALARWENALGEDVWRLDVEPRPGGRRVR